MIDVLDNRTGCKYKMSKHWGLLECWEHLAIIENTSLASAEGLDRGTQQSLKWKMVKTFLIRASQHWKHLGYSRGGLHHTPEVFNCALRHRSLLICFKDVYIQLEGLMFWIRLSKRVL